MQRHIPYKGIEGCHFIDELDWLEASLPCCSEGVCTMQLPILGAGYGNL